MRMSKNFIQQRGEIATALTVVSLVIVALGAFLGSSMSNNNTSLSSQAARKKATAPLSCPAGYLKGPFSGIDCSGKATGRIYACQVRVIADTFNVETEILPDGKEYFRIEGNFCFTGKKTSGGQKGFLYITNEHPGKRACIISDPPTEEHTTYYPSDYPLCDQTGQWATLNPKGPIPDRFKKIGG